MPPCELVLGAAGIVTGGSAFTFEEEAMLEPLAVPELPTVASPAFELSALAAEVSGGGVKEAGAPAGISLELSSSLAQTGLASMANVTMPASMQVRIIANVFLCIVVAFPNDRIFAASKNV
jgi:hypothetical protein